MAKYYKIDSRIWLDKTFLSISVSEKLDVIRRITEGTEEAFAKYIGPMFRVADSPKRRPDLSTAKWRSLRQSVIEALGATCHYCGCDCAQDPTVDHVLPVSEGHDPYDPNNLVVACRPCNSKKGPRMPEESS